MNNCIVIGTSIAPFNIETQKECVLSWIRSGFKVFSFNCASEIELLKDAFSDVDVEFVEIKRSAVGLCEKELPFIQDILDGVSMAAEEICGYFNSDIYFDNITESLYEYICDEARDSLVIVHRNEINSFDDIKDMNWDINLDGIDGFFIGKHHTQNLYGEWAFVQTVWDSFLLIMCKKNNIPVKTLFNPIAFHKRHLVRWDYARTEKTYDAVIQNYYSRESNGRRAVFYDNYNYLYEYSHSIVHCERIDYKVLFVVEKTYQEQMESIKNQGLPDFEITTTLPKKIQEYDFVFEIKRGIILDEKFCRFVFHLFETYQVKEIEIGCFFLSKVENRMIFNQLNKNMTQLAKINHQCSLFSRVIANSSKNTVTKTVLYPLSYEYVDVFNQSIVNRIKLDGDTYIMPAGYRSGEWYAVNRDHLRDMNLVGFLDNNENKVGSFLLDKKIYSANETLNEEKKFNLILCTKYHQEEIRKQIENKHSAKLVDADMVLWVDEMGQLYVFDLQNYKRMKGL